MTRIAFTVMSILCLASLAGAAPDTPRDLDTHHLFTPPATKADWEKRAAAIKKRILVSCGLWPMPEKTPLNPMVTGKIDAPDYTIENVALETRPGFFLCGNLYRPKGKKGPFPGIVQAHGHWSTGRLTMEPDVEKADPNGKMGAGKANLVSIGVNLARQGFVVFAYDMIGYNDTTQVDHKFAGNPESWLWGVSLAGLQTWNSIRVIDYLQSLPDVDKKRIGVTGASGGGTQTFLLAAIDDRIKCSVPVNMVSAYMQGGCLCENAPGLRVDTDNSEIAALVAPRPQLLVSCTGDWTSKVPQEEWPTVRKVYDLYGAGDKTAVVQYNYGHNYNIESREAMFAFFGKWLKNDPNPEHFREKPFNADASRMHIWTSARPMPSTALKEVELIEALKKDSAARCKAAIDSDNERVIREGLAISLGVEPKTTSIARARATLSQSGAKSGGKTALIVEVAPGSSEATAIQDALQTRGYKCMRLVIPAIDMSSTALWSKFFTCYNQPPAGRRVQKIVDWLTDMGGQTALIGLGDAGPWCLMARAIQSGSGPTVADLAGNDMDADSTYVADLYAPCLRGLGGMESAILVAQGPVRVHHISGDHAWGQSEAGGRREKSTRTVQMAPIEIAEWIATHNR